MTKLTNIVLRKYYDTHNFIKINLRRSNNMEVMQIQAALVRIKMGFLNGKMQENILLSIVNMEIYKYLSASIQGNVPVTYYADFVMSHITNVSGGPLKLS